MRETTPASMAYERILPRQIKNKVALTSRASKLNCLTRDFSDSSCAAHGFLGPKPEGVTCCLRNLPSVFFLINGFTYSYDIKRYSQEYSSFRNRVRDFKCVDLGTMFSLRYLILQVVEVF